MDKSLRNVIYNTVVQCRHLLECDLARQLEGIYGVHADGAFEPLDILRGVKERYEAHHNVLIAEDALEAAVKLSVGWMPERRLPDKALDLLDEACARARIPTISSPADLSAGLVVTAYTIAEVLSAWVGVPAEGLLDCVATGGGAT